LHELSSTLSTSHSTTCIRIKPTFLKKKGAESVRAFVLRVEKHYCTVRVTACELFVMLSVPVTVRPYEPGTVAGRSVSEPVPDLLVSVTETAVILAEAGSPEMIVGAVYVAVVAPVDWIVPVDADQVTPLPEGSLLTVAVKVAV
jgi:hypothetical protein